MATLEQRIRIAQYWGMAGNLAGWGIVVWGIIAWSKGMAWYAALFFVFGGFAAQFAPWFGLIAWWKLGWFGFAYLVMGLISLWGWAQMKDAAYAVATGRDPDELG